MYTILWEKKKMKKTKKQLIKELQQQVHDLKVELETQNYMIIHSLKELTEDLEIRKFKEKAKGEKYIVKLGENKYMGLKIDISYLSEGEKKLIQFNAYIDNGNFRGVNVDYKVNEDYIEIYDENEIVYVGKVKGYKLEDVDLELYKKSYPYSVNLKKNVCESNKKIVDFMKEKKKKNSKN